MRDFSQRRILLEMYSGDPYIEFMRAKVPPGGSVIDVGANIGFYTVLAGLAVGCTGQVHAFEPQPAIYEQLVYHIALNNLDNCCFANAMAVGESSGSVTLVVPSRTHSGIAHLACRDGTAGAAEEERMEVPCIALDDYLREHKIHRIDYLKMDVEGAELLVCKGAKEMWRRMPPTYIQCEVGEEQCAQMGYSPRDLLSFLGEMGYQGYLFDTAGQLCPTSAEALEGAMERPYTVDVILWQ